ncbi:MAG TPA: TPM domain-containing protein [Myxococcaceae bacterium]
MKSLLLLPALLLLAAPAHAALRFPAPPGSGEHVVDAAELIDSDDEAEIQQIAAKLLEQERVQLVVVTIDSMAEYGGARMNIEDYADRLFEAWGIGNAEAETSDESQGILLLVSRLDRKARIELGPAWGYSKDSEAWRIMDKHLVPAFKRGNYSSGLVYGASALDRMVRGLNPPRAPLSQEQMMLYAGGAVLGFFTIVSLIRSGTSGWAWAFWGIIFSILGFILSVLATPNRRRSRWGSSYSSGSSWSSGGGGRSSGRGGGATGSW